MFPIHTILHPTDFSPRAEAAFRMAAALARDYKARLLVAHVQQFQTPVVGEFGVMPIGPDDSVEALQDKLREFHAGENVSMERHLLRGDAVTEIIALAREVNADLIVLGTHGRTGLSRLLMGSVAELVVRRSPCMVLTVKAPATAAEILHAAEAEDMMQAETAGSL